METLVTVHSWVRWLVLFALVGGAALGLMRYSNKANWESSVFQLGVMTVDIQVAIGIVIWFERKGWNYSFFCPVLPPRSRLAARAVAQVGLAVANRRSDARS